MNGRLPLLSACTLLWAALGFAAAADSPARQILDLAGVHGGLIVHLGCGDGRLTAALHSGPGCLVHGLEARADSVQQARDYLRGLGLYGPVSVEQFSGDRLPYTDNLVDLLVAEDLGPVSSAEVLRVLVPGGAACVKRDGAWQKTVKPWPAEIDAWTHWMHDASNNAVAGDTCVGPPRRMQWLAEPLWTRGHEVISSIGGVVTAGGRIFYALDEGQTGIYSLPSKWNLVARDAFNGVLLWKRPLPDWAPPVVPGGFTNGFRPRRLVTDGPRVWLPWGPEARLTALDAASGEILKTLDDAPGTAEILSADGLVVAVGSPSGAKRKGAAEDAGSTLSVFRSETFERLWTASAAGLVPSTAAMSDGRIFFQADNRVLALQARDGRSLWETPLAKQPPSGERRKPAAPGSLMVHQGIVYAASGSRLTALSAEAGKLLWQRNDAHSTRGELFAADGLLWRAKGSQMLGHDPASGEVRRTVDASGVFSEGHHPRCYPCKATERYVIANNRGAEFVSLTGQQSVSNDWLRGSCGHGVVPANGLLYVPPNPCFCYPGVKLLGFNALAPESKSQVLEQGTRLDRGPASAALSPVPRPLSPADWPTFRHDAARSGSSTTPVAPDVAVCWTAELSGRLTPPVVGDGRLYVAAVDQHTLHAFAADDGRPLWQFTTGGRIDSPPTIDGPRVLFGSADGYVYCLHAADGQMAWRFRAAPDARRIVAFGQLESPWRVHGSVLLAGGVVYCTAGRSSYLDGGIWLFGLDPQTGAVRCEARVDTWTANRPDAVGQPFIPGYHMDGALSDVLVSQDGALFLGQMKFDLQLRRLPTPYQLLDPQHKTAALDMAGQPFSADNENPSEDYEKHQRDWLDRNHPDLTAALRSAHGGFNLGVRQMGLHLLATSGLLDDSGFNRTYWMYSTVWPGFYLGHRGAKSGQLLVVGPQRTYAVQSFTSRNLQSPLFTPGAKGDLLLADDNGNEPALDDATVEVTKGWGFTRSRAPEWFAWVPIRIRAMVLAGPTLFVAGPPDVVDPADPYAALDGRRGGVLRAVSAADGRQQAELKLAAPPVFDGLIAAGARLYVSTTDGKVQCLAPRSPIPPVGG